MVIEENISLSQRAIMNCKISTANICPNAKSPQKQGKYLHTTGNQDVNHLSVP